MVDLALKHRKKVTGPLGGQAMNRAGVTRVCSNTGRV